MIDTATYRRRLMDRLKELDGRLHRIEGDLDEPASRDWEEAAVEREDDEMLERLGQAGLDEIGRIRAALARVRDGSYGICARCGEDIEAARLDAVPETPLCRSCAGG